MEVTDFNKFLPFFFWVFFTYSSDFFTKQYFTNTSTSFVTENVILITSLQVGCGSLLYVALKLRHGHDAGLRLDFKTMLLGACHSYGTLMTNSSLAQTTASLTHLVKMSEPFFVTFLMAIMGKSSFNFKILLIMIIIIFTAVGSEPISKANSSIHGIIFALASNLCFAFRNIGIKNFSAEDLSDNKITLEGFASLSFGGLLSLVPLWVFSFIIGSENYDHILTNTNTDLNFFLIASSLSHSLYNILSLTIIFSIFNPAQHSMLNVCRSTSIVIVFYIFSQQPFTLFNLMSAAICLIVSGTAINAMEVKKEKEPKCVEIDWKYIFVGILTLLFSMSFLSWTVTSQMRVQPTPIPANIAAAAQSAKKDWLQCIDDIQQEIINKLSDHLTDPSLLQHPSPLLLIDPAYGGNVGDNLIAYGELVLMERMGFLNHTECHIIQSQRMSKFCDNFTHIEDGGMAWWHGGGNWGDLWDRQALTLRRMRSFIQLVNKGKTVIGMPQSFHYRDKQLQNNDSIEWMKAIKEETNYTESKTNMVLTWRQQESLKEGVLLYPLLDNRLVPDVAFMIGPLEESNAWSKKRKQVELIFLLRVDKESKHKNERNVKMLRKIIDKNEETRGLSFELVDWWDRDKFFDKRSKEPGPLFKYKVLDEGKFDYQKMFKSSMAMLTGGKVLITDRLHSSILAFLMHKPHIYLDQMYGKIRKTREVAFDVSEHCGDREEMRYDEAQSIEEAVLKASRMINDPKLWVN